MGALCMHGVVRCKRHKSLFIGMDHAFPAIKVVPSIFSTVDLEKVHWPLRMAGIEPQRWIDILS